MITTRRRHAAFQAAMYISRHNRIDRAAVYAAAHAGEQGALAGHELADIFAAIGTVGFSGSTWDPAHVDAGITLSDSNHLATFTVFTGAYVTGTRPKAVDAGGKRYLELDFANITSQTVFALADDTYTEPGGIQTAQAFLYVDNAFIACWNNDISGTGYSGSGSIDFAVDMDASPMKFYERTNNGAWLNSGDPAAGTGGLTPGSPPVGHLKLALVCNNVGATFAINTGDRAFTRTPPAGFSAWD